ncbi:Ankyrin repeat domain containing protein [Pandoravirus neocaledonia]|uniref:Ankyrin repeat domain containing protein n=1 Tax=Pandoravirus neocaledonia TaxID=2107708 RepID=A0A2U7UD73_9VIRU|nr:Ankyrin repeat domain containing protein [Pandoravirus neocaledonia]AVK76352.1 Ankyrin repeat domain containing protein [Pandoravirus neocaledonia]
MDNDATQEVVVSDSMGQALGLADMPPEIIVHVLAWVDLKDRAACATASPLLAVEPLSAVAARCRALCLSTALAAGAPLHVVEQIVTYRRAVVRPMLLKWAARGGRLDVVDWVHARLDKPIEVRREHRDDTSEDEADYCEHDRAQEDPSTTTPEEKTTSAGRRRKRDPLQKKRHRKRHRVYRSDERYTGPTIAALYEAAYRGHAVMLAALLDRWRIDFGDVHGQRLLHALMIETCSGPTPGTDTFELLHHHSARLSKDGSCECWPDAGRAAASAERVDILAWMQRVGCRARLYTKWPAMFKCDTPFCKAIRKGRAPVARWLADVMEVASWSERDKDIGNAMESAAARGHLHILDMFHGLGSQVCPPGAIIMAARCGHLNIVQWSLRDTSTPAGLSDSRQATAPMCPPLSIGWAAAESGRAHIVRWLAQRPDARRFLAVGAARAALAKGHVDVALCLHAAGIARLDQWDSLATAVTTGKVDVVETAARHGAPYDIGAFVNAIHQGNAEIVACLCKRYGTADVQAAVDAVAGPAPGPDREVPRTRILKWLRDNVPDVCIANTAASSSIRHVLYCHCGRCLSVS